MTMTKPTRRSKRDAEQETRDCIARLIAAGCVETRRDVHSVHAVAGHTAPELTVIELATEGRS